MRSETDDFLHQFDLGVVAQGAGRAGKLADIERQFQGLHRAAREKREAVDPRSMPDEVELQLSSILAKIVRLRVEVEGKPDTESDTISADDEASGPSLG